MDIQEILATMWGMDVELEKAQHKMCENMLGSVICENGTFSIFYGDVIVDYALDSKKQFVVTKLWNSQNEILNIVS